MNERGMLIASAAVGAALGVAVGYLFFTDRGRQLRRDFEPELQGLLQEAVRLKAAVSDMARGFDEIGARGPSAGQG